MSKLCEFLRSVNEVEECTRFLNDNGYVSHALSCKDWDLAKIIPEIKDGNFLDMGSCESYILTNVVNKNICGQKYGVDLRLPTVVVSGVKYLVGNLINVPMPDKYFKYLTCLSVIEHGVDLEGFAKEASRLLENGGRVFVTFDYWDPTITPSVQLYGLPWRPLDKPMVSYFISICEKYGLYLVGDVDWTIKDPVIKEGYYSPEAGIRYTFGILTFEKK